jgi:radical SAM protein with 4Fe4S-binding SPASM domain
MSVEVRPLGVKCNIQCAYCYQNPQRDAQNILHKFDLARMKEGIAKAIEETGERDFVVFGGEPLLAPLDVLEDLFAWGHERYGASSIQTNGTLISERHLQLFNRYNVHVGISIDGPDELNDSRWHHDQRRTRQATSRTMSAIERLCSERRPPSLIVTLSRTNARPECLERMNAWFRFLDESGIRSVRLHILESESSEVRDKYGLSDDENISAFLNFHELEKTLSSIRFDVFDEMRLLLLGKDAQATCVWRACDPLTTSAVRGIEGNGQISNCGRTNKDGIDFVKSAAPGFERYISLYHTPQDNGGCKGCRFFLMCKGQCPGTALNGDWRYRTEHCAVWKALFAKFESDLMAEGEIPLSTAPIRSRIEGEMLKRWSAGDNPSIEHVIDRCFATARAT